MRKYLVLLALLSTSAHAGGGHVLKGVFCNTHKQITAVMDMADKFPKMPVEMLLAEPNTNSTECVYRTTVLAMIVNPVYLGTLSYKGVPYHYYQGTLVGVLVGNNPREIKPPVQTFFVREKRLEGEQTKI